MNLSAKKVVPIWGNSNAWSLAPHRNADAKPTECDVHLEIQGSPKSGFFLLMSPDGFSTADYCYDTLKDAKESAKELFGVSDHEWS